MSRRLGEQEVRRLRKVSGPMDPGTIAILRMVNGDPIHARDRTRLIGAIVADARAHSGHVSSNRVRRRLTDKHGELVVYPRMMGALYGALIHHKVLVVDGWETNNDKRGHNTGKPCRTYVLASSYWASRVGQPADG